MMKSKAIFAIIAGFAMLGVAGVSALGMAGLAAAVPSDNCVATIHTAMADKTISASDREAMQAACGGSAPEDCLAAIEAADKRVTKVEAQAIRDACGISQA